MTKKMQSIPARIKNIAKGGHVAGTEDIIDDNLNKTQNVINAENNSKFIQLDNEIEGLEKQDVVPVDTLPDVSSADTKKIYRVVGEDSYTDYMVNASGDGWKTLATYSFPGIDDEPTAGSNNLVKSGGVAEIINKRYQKENTFFALTDNDGNMLIEIIKDSKAKNGYRTVFYTDTKDSLDEYEFDRTDTEDKLFAISDNDGNVFFEIKDGKGFLYGKVIDFDNNAESEDKTYDYYKDKIGLLWSVSRYNITGEKRLQLMITTDTHTELTGLDNAFLLSNKFESIDAVLSLGDLCDSVTDAYDGSKDIWANKTFRRYVVVGNHDVGEYSKAIELTKSSKQFYDDFIKPSLDFFDLSEENGHIPEAAENKCYWYHDFKSYTPKVRLIGLYPFDDNCGRKDSLDNVYGIDNSVWSPVDYNPLYDNIQEIQYLAGSKINLPGYTEYSFKAVNDVTVEALNIKPTCSWNRVAYNNTYNNMVIGNSYSVGDYANVPGYTEASFKARINIPSLSDYPTNTDIDNPTHPKYKACRSLRWYSSEQLEWLCELLVDAAAKNYVVIIAQHYPAFNNIYCVADDNKVFNNDLKFYNILDEFGNVSYAAGVGSNSSSRFDNNSNDIIAKIVHAYYTKESIDLNITPESSWRKFANFPQYSDVCYDDCSDIQQASVHHDFSEDEYDTPSLVGFISGHNHSDGVLRHKEYNNMTDIVFSAGRIDKTSDKDISRGNKGEFGYDALTSYTILSDGVHLCRIGNDAAVKKTGNKIAYKNNEFVEF